VFVLYIQPHVISFKQKLQEEQEEPVNTQRNSCTLEQAKLELDDAKNKTKKTTTPFPFQSVTFDKVC